MARPSSRRGCVATRVAAVVVAGLSAGGAEAQTVPTRTAAPAATSASSQQNAVQASQQAAAMRTRGAARAQADAGGIDQTVRDALRAQPLLRGYALEATARGRQVVLTGRVGSSRLHDIALQAAMATGAAIRDDLVIDTAEMHRVAMLIAAASSAPALQTASGPSGAPSLGVMPGTLYTSASVPYVYPPPLFGRLDDPFFGFEPPLVSYPPWWGYVARREPIDLDKVAAAGLLMPPYGLPGPPATASQPQAEPVAVPVERRPAAPFKREFPRDPNVPPPPPTPDVPRMRPAAPLENPAARAPGSTERPAAPLENPAAPPRFEPSGRPTPAVPAQPVSPAAVLHAPSSKLVVLSDRAGALADRLERVLSDRPALAGLPLKVVERSGEVTISGKVPTVYEAMLAYRAVEQTPGVKSIQDKLEFAVPDDDHKNPLLAKGRPVDVESYAAAQIRRQLGDQAHLDRVRLNGGALEVEGTLARPEDAERIAAILRSMPILRGFKLEPRFHAD